MTGYFKVYLYLFAVILTGLLFSCSHGKPNPRVSQTPIVPQPPGRQFDKEPYKKYIPQQTLLSYVNQSNTIEPNHDAGPPFNKLNYNKVIAYDYDGVGGDGEDIYEIIENNKLIDRINKQQQLSQQQVNDLTNCLGAKSTYGHTYAFCFEPNFGVVFYNGTKIVAGVSIALGCNYLRSSIPIPATWADSISIGKNYKYPAEGFSKKGNKNLLGLAKKLQFTPW